MQLQEALRLYLLVDRAVSTQQTYERLLSRLVADIGPRRHLDRITPEDLDAYIADLRGQRVKYAAHPTRPIVEEPLASATIGKWIKTVKAFFNWCTERELIDRSPARYLSNRRPPRVGQGKAARAEEVFEVLAAARYKPRDRAVVWLLSSQSMRLLRCTTGRELPLPAYFFWARGLVSHVTIRPQRGACAQRLRGDPPAHPPGHEESRRQRPGGVLLDRAGLLFGKQIPGAGGKSSQPRDDQHGGDSRVKRAHDDLHS
ncbi:MAG: hypothetical protein WCZ87_00235 [Thiohalobacteraceae bacterium]